MIKVPKGLYLFCPETNTHSITYDLKRQFTISCDSLEGLLNLVDEFFCNKPHHNSVVKYNRSFITSQEDTVWLKNVA